ncbi:RagB/SusD family nutrient uptake outer membrane protein [Algoriphagus sp. AGSA1]|uniref:RagB/SusD family nutrient uptake outer membrane protein n=1 Tax=Algoriphagus sp. AGSA1 TaxID=2907213 RepID=UPI001F2ED522|nr:RagB/SusD family nutrient uptake outer membrane protein [Algoriphagus sp. AGSA1]MCE7054722.1 RagB/SusD family nutrient uptake outer membrane protein [Algoriphagus sp. AGSA1]
MKNYNLLLITVFSWMFCSCDSYLDPKPDQSLLVPRTLEDVQYLLDNNVVFNFQGFIPLLAADEFSMTEEAFTGASVTEQGAYTWSEELFPTGTSTDWNQPYEAVFYSNVALDALGKYTGERDKYYYELEGAALFYRSMAYNQLLQTFAPPYQLEGGNEQLLGIVLRDDPDINLPSERANLQKSYTRIIEDLETALDYLPDYVEYKTRPNKAAAASLLARVQLSVFDYAAAAQSAEIALDFYTERMDFNDIDSGISLPFSLFNAETIYYTQLQSTSVMFSQLFTVDNGLVESYDSADLRFRYYFQTNADGNHRLTGHHTGSSTFFGGLTVGENLLIASESNLRLGDEGRAKSWLGELLSLRYEDDSYREILDLEGEELLARILLERRKELVGRGTRWSDLRRLNQEAIWAKSVQRDVGGIIYNLEPTSAAYVYPIPDQEILRSGIEQNQR